MVSGFLFQSMGTSGVNVEVEDALQVGDLPAGFFGERWFPSKE